MAHHILPGSFELNGAIAIAGVHTGANEWDVKDLRYVRCDLSSVKDKTRSVSDVFGEVYDNSTGCMVEGDFKLN